VFYLLSTEEPLTTAAPLGIILKEYYGVHLTFIINWDNGLTAVKKELILLLPTEPKLSKFEKFKICEFRKKTNKGNDVLNRCPKFKWEDWN